MNINILNPQPHTNNNIRSFLTKENVNMLWEVIEDENFVKFLKKDAQQNIQNVFKNNLKDFYEKEFSNSTDLIELNKKYVMLMISYITQNFQYNKPNKIKIHNNNLEIDGSGQKELITYEEIQNDKKTQFEMELTQRKEEFENAMEIKVPSTPIFKDTLNDAPITEMEKMIQEITQQRNYDVEQINKIHSLNSLSNSWLEPQKTSNKQKQNDTKKNVTWGQTDNIYIEEKEYNSNKETHNYEIQQIYENNFKQINERIDKLNQNINSILHILQNKNEIKN